MTVLTNPQSHAGRDWSPTMVLALLSAAFVIVVALIEYNDPVLYVMLIAEDCFGENLTAMAYLLAAGLFAYAACRSRGLMRLGYAALALATFGVGGEEISWGQRLLGIGTPELLAEVNRQQELTLHNIGSLQRAPFHPVAGFGLLALLAASVLRDRSGGYRLLRLVPLPPPAMAPLILATSYVLVVQPFVKGDEIGEIMLALAFLAWAALDVHPLVGAGVKAYLTPTRSLLAAALLTLALTSALDSRPAEGLGWRYNITAGRDYPARGMNAQALKLYDFILQHPEYMQGDTRDNVAKLRAAAST